MQVKVFEAADMATGMKMVKDEFGPDALILSTKTIRPNKLGLLGKKRFEITAAVDSGWPDEDSEPIKAIDTGTYDRGLRIQNNTPEPVEENTPSDSKDTALQSEVDELKEMMKTLGQEMTRMTTRQPGSPALSLSNDTSLQSLLQRITDLGISQENAQTIAGFASESLTLEGLTDPFVQQEYLTNTIEGLLNVSTDLFKRKKEDSQIRLALIGPTGVGKTTSLAKIAANYLSCQSLSIGFITIDTYRIAAVEQLKVYGDIMNLPVEVVLTPEQFEQALLKMRDKDLILIDTAGRSPHDKLCIEELASFLRSDLEIEKHLVLSATTRGDELFEVMERFSILGIDHTIITKIDECLKLGVLLDLQIRSKIPYSFIANGQRVPEDIMEADVKTLTSLIMSPGEGSSYE